VATSTIRITPISPDFLSLYGIRLLSGRPLSESRSDDVMAHEDTAHYNVIINEAAARYLGFTPESALGRKFYSINARSKTTPRAELTIVGVTSDFRFKSDKVDVSPTYYFNAPGGTGWVSVRVPADAVSQALSDIDRTWHQFSPSTAIDRHFVDQDFEQQFSSEERQGKIFGSFVGIAIFIAALGLFGLAAFSTERRTKEIGLRKTFGARTRDIILLLLWQFSVPVLIANALAWPIAWYYLNGWLEGYAYRISLNPLYFVGSGAVALVIAWATVIVHAAHVAKANPIHALRYE
jgi:putative ABC transport system permease protein